MGLVGGSFGLMGNLGLLAASLLWPDACRDASTLDEASLWIGPLLDGRLCCDWMHTGMHQPLEELAGGLCWTHAGMHQPLEKLAGGLD